MRTFPKFLKAMPEFYGLTFTDLGSVMVMLYISMMLGLAPLLSLGLCGAGVAVTKFMKKNFDFTGWFLPKKNEIYIHNVKRGEE